MPQKVKMLLVLAVAVCAGGVIVFFAMQLQKSSQSKQNSVLAAQHEVATVINQVGKLMELPSGEIPTVATVADMNKLKNQPFFAHAKNGDKVLIYPQSKEAILYRPGTNKIITVAPVNIQNTPSAAPVKPTSVTDTPTPTLKPKPTVFFKPFTSPAVTGTITVAPTTIPSIAP